jgi:hypothetical protein
MGRRRGGQEAPDELLLHGAACRCLRWVPLAQLVSSTYLARKLRQLVVLGIRPRHFLAIRSATLPAWLSQQSPYKDTSARPSSYSSSLRYSTSSFHVRSCSASLRVRVIVFPRKQIPALMCELTRGRFNTETGLLEPSSTMFERAPPMRTRIALEVLELLRLVRLDRLEPTESSKSNGISSHASRPRRGQIISSTNLTILNFLLVHFGPLHERTLCLLVGGIQVACSVLAFGVRYGIGAWVYGGERR